MSDVPSAVKEETLIDDALAGNIETFATSLLAAYEPEKMKIFRTIGAFIMQGMTYEESCMLSRVDHRKVTILREKDESLDAFFKFKELSYKAKLMRVITSKAVDSASEKSAGWLLEKRYPGEFNAKPADPNDGKRDHLLDEGIRAIRSAGDSQPIVPAVPAAKAA